MNNTIVEKRDAYADYVKGLLIILVVLGHTIQYNNSMDDFLYKSIYMFHMPLFISISGYFTYFSLQRKPASEFIKERILTLLIPLITWGLINALFDIMFKGDTIPNKCMYIYMVIRNSYWFIWVILFHSVLFGILKLIKLDNRYLIAAIGVLSMLIPLFFSKNVVLAFTKDMLCFFILGYLLAYTNINKLYLFCKRYFIVIITLTIACYHIWTNEDLIYFTPSDILHLKTGILRFVAGIIISAGFLTITFFIYKLSEKSKITGYLTLLGTKTMGIYLIQGFMFSFLIGRLFNLNSLSAFPSIFYIIPALVIVTICYFIIKLAENNGLASFIFFGKRRKKSNEYLNFHRKEQV
jgi:fucose 4-O-acetylase-like acetyltransferase